MCCVLFALLLLAGWLDSLIASRREVGQAAQQLLAVSCQLPLCTCSIVRDSNHCCCAASLPTRRYVAFRVDFPTPQAPRGISTLQVRQTTNISK